MKYTVTLKANENIDIGFKRPTVKRVNVDSASLVSVSLSQLYDVNPVDKQNNYILMWDSATQKHVYVPPSEVLDRADGVDDGSLDYGIY